MKLAFRLAASLAALLLLARVAPAQVIISEFMADNKQTLADEDGQFPDWIELYNTTTNPVSLAGWALTDDATHATRWSLPATNLSAKGFLVVFASGKNRAVPGAPLHTDFSLKASGEYLGLLRPDGSIATDFAPTFPPQYPDISYGLAQDVTTNTLVARGAAARTWVPTNSALGATWTQTNFDDSTWIRGGTGVGYETAGPGFGVYNYVASVGVCTLAAAQGVIANPAQQRAVYAENPAVINYFNTGGAGHYASDRTFPGLTVGVDQDNYAVEATATITIPAPGNWTFGVNSDDGFLLIVGGSTSSYSNPRGPGDTLQTFNFPAAGTYPLDLVFFECGGGSEVELFAAQGSYTAWDAVNFHLVGDTANGGLAVTAPVVSGGSGGISYRPFIGTDLQAAMNNVNASAYLRLPFTVADPAALQSLTLQMMYDDGFVAYLNGQEVARRNAPDSPQWNSTATAAHPNAQALLFEPINLSDHLAALRAGTNLLAIQGLNRSADDTDFLLLPELTEYRVNGQTNRYFSTPTPGGLNGTGFIAYVADTKFSVDRGFFTNAFSLAITTATANATILYTTNGSTPSLTNGLVYSGPLTIRGTTVIRAAAFKTGFQPSDVDTHTCVFPADVILQSPTGQAPAGWPTSWGANAVDYGMDPDIVTNAAYSGEIVSDLQGIPSFSIVTDLGNLFDPATGIYANAAQDGRDWERPASIELIYPDGTKGFQVNAGIRIRGGYSRSTGNPKHAFRFFFRSDYGPSQLDFPVFARQHGATSFDGFDLRTFENYSWSFEGDYRFIGLRDQWSRDTLYAQGQPTERGDFYHLYINGQYWGLYNTDERPEASYGASYFGGDKADYDVIKVDTGAGYTIFATDGNMDAWTRLWMAATNGFADDASYFRIQGLNVDGTPNPAYENLLEVDDLIDYMLAIFFTGNIDAPISAFIGNTNPNNMYAVRNRTGRYGGFRFLAHDSEHTLLHESSLGNNDELHRDRTGPFAAGDPVQQGTDALARSNPQYLLTRLTANAEFRLRLADHIQRQFFNGGTLTTEGCRARLLTRSNEIYGAVAAESARWGDSKVNPPRTRNVDWVTEMNRVYGDYFGLRPGIVLGQLRAKNWFPPVAAPTFSQFGGNVTNGFPLAMSTPAGTIYYTLDGSDPRLRGGAVSPTAQVYSSAVALTRSARVQARVLSGVTWSALSDATFYVIQDFADVLITEIMYHPPDTPTLDGDEFEFIELKSVAPVDRELSGAHFTSGVTFTFPIGTVIAPGQFLVLVSNPAAFTNKYPGVRVDGVYSNHLSNSGETLTLVHAAGAPLGSVKYGTRVPWPELADGGGFSLVPVNPNLNPAPDDPLNWRASAVIGGSPGADDLAAGIPRVLINEVLTHTDPPDWDSVELYNPSPTNVTVGGWFLTDQRTAPQKYQLPAGTTIPGNGYLVITELNWNADPQSTNSFRLDSHGEEIYLYSADPNGALTGFSDGFAFGAAQNGITFGRYVNSVGDIQYPAQSARTLGRPNAGPRVGPVVINEIHYHPAPGGDAFVELKSVTNKPVALYDPLYPTNTWRLSGIGFDFPTNVILAPTGLVLVVAGDPGTFRTKYGVPAAVPIFGPYAGTLQHSGETLALQCPDHPDVDTNTGAVFVPRYDVDVVRYNDKSPWPTNADGGGPALERRNAWAYGNDPVNWRAGASGGSPGLENNGNRAPLVNAGPDLALDETNAPLALPLSGAAADDGLPDPPAAFTTTWSQVSGPGAVWFSDARRTNATAGFPGTGTYVLRLTADDGAVQTSDDVTITIQRSLATTPLTLIAKGSVWKYLDNGSNPGTAWRSNTFNDATWKSGPAPLGYGDANGQWPATTNSYGANASSKYITTYYRRSFTVAHPELVTNLVVNVQRDDGVVLYLNGAAIYTNNLPAGAITYQTLALVAVGGTDETAFYSQSVDPLRLRFGTNVLAAEIHQANVTSSDIIFDLELAGETFPTNAAPLADAGPTQTVTLPAVASLHGTAADDGLPIPPGLLSFAWTRVSGPGAVTFSDPAALDTTASFSASGSYVLRLVVQDGALAASNEVAITVSAPVQPPFRVDAAELTGGAASQVRLRFTATAGIGYTVQRRDSLTAGAWVKLADISPPAETQPVEVTDAGATNAATRYYRVVTPIQP